MTEEQSKHDYEKAYAAALQSQCAREKYWKELSIEEKLERTRQMVEVRENEIRSMAEELVHLRRKLDRLSRHQHGALGEVLTAFHDSGSGDNCGELIGHGYPDFFGRVTKPTQNPDEVYF